MKFLAVALKNLLRRRVRSALTLLGIAVGIAMLFSFTSFNAGYQASLRQDLNRLGAHMLAIAKGCPYEATAMVMHGGVIEDFLTEEHVATIRAMPNVKTAVGMFMNQKIIHDAKPVIIQGLDDAGFALKPWWVIEGKRFIDANSVILPAAKATAMALSIGSEYRIPGVDQAFTVTGILQKTGSQDDQFIYMPLLTAQRLFNAEGKVTSVAIQLHDLRQVQAVVGSVEALPDVQAITMSQMLGTVQTLMESAQALITSIVIIAVLISALGVLNSILTSVFERTREIGMMKAVGAGAADIFALVWLESILLTVTGGALGIAAAIGAGTLIESALRDILPFAPAGNLITFNPDIAGMSLLVSVVLGVVAGAYPALRAAGLSPMEAIRNE